MKRKEGGRRGGCGYVATFQWKGGIRMRLEYVNWRYQDRVMKSEACVSVYG
jgi:hypothetical protein